MAGLDLVTMSRGSISVGRSGWRTLKNDFSLTERSAIEKLRARMLYKRLLRLRYTFPFKNKTPTKSAKSISSHLPVP
jgi:hypothetical protein